MSAHTPAPWIAERDPCHFDTLSTVTAAPNGRMIVQVGGTAAFAGRVAEQEANTRLIAAAPDLLAALVECADDLHAEINARCCDMLSSGVVANERRYERDMQPVVTARAVIAKATGVTQEPPKQEASPRLIAAAPDLLEALRLWVVFDKTGTPNGEFNNAIKATYAAIAKATEL